MTKDLFLTGLPVTSSIDTRIKEARKAKKLKGFTDSKWYYVTKEMSNTGKHTISTSDTMICTIEEDGIGNDEVIANAKLIASAPQLKADNEVLKAEIGSWKKEHFEIVEQASETIKELQERCMVLTEALQSCVDYLTWSESFPVEDAEEGNENCYTQAKAALNIK